MELREFLAKHPDLVVDADLDRARTDIDIVLPKLVEVFKTIFGTRLVAVVLRGSTMKPWISALDYIPRLSDVDIHVYLKRKGLVKDYTPRWRDAKRLQALTEAVVFGSELSHYPRLQVKLLLVNWERYEWAPTTPGTFRMLYGDHIPEQKRPLEESFIKDRDNLLKSKDVREMMSRQIVPKAGDELFTSLRSLSWRISPLLSRMIALTTHGLETWKQCRTETVLTAYSLDFNQSTDLVVDFYKNSRRFLAGEGSAYAIAALECALEALELGYEFASNIPEDPPQ